MGHVQHLSFESLVKMDHFQKEPPLNLKGTTGQRKKNGNAAQTKYPLWVTSGHFALRKFMSALPPESGQYQILLVP